MVLLTVVAPLYNRTIYFRHPLPKPNYIRLISCSLYNSWYNLKDNGVIKIENTTKRTPGSKPIINNNNDGPIFLSVTSGYDTPESMKKAISDSLAEHSSPKITIDLNTSLGNIVINNPKNQYNLKTLFGVVQTNRSSIIVKLMPYEKVRYQTPQTHVLRDTSTGKYTNSLTISVWNEKGELFGFNGFPLEFEIEIN